MIFDALLVVSVLLFIVGLVTVITKKNIIMVLIGIELIFNAANLNLVSFSKYDPLFLQGQMLALFVIVIAACEAAVALAIVIQAIKMFKTSDLDDMSQIKD